MPLPEGFNEWEHLQNTLRRAHNSTVNEFFRNQADNDVSSSKASAKHACKMKDEDTADMTVIRMWLFWVLCRKMRDNFEPYAGYRIPNDEHSVKHKPHVTILFLQDHDDVEYGDRPVEGQISFRLIDETTKSMTEAKLMTLANKITQKFGTGKGFVWQKGKDNYTYVDKELGHRHKVLVTNKVDAEEIIKKILDITNDPFKASLLRVNKAEDPNSAFPNNPGKQTILGKTHDKPRLRPVVKVRFFYAQIKLSGLPKPIILVDSTGYWSDALVKTWKL